MSAPRFVIFIFSAMSAVVSTGCFSLGPRQLGTSQVDYAVALGDAKKRQILSTIVGLRFADAPGFLTASQIIASFEANASAGASASTRPGGGGAAFQGASNLGAFITNKPTFTFTPVTGEAYASFIRPLPPTLVLPLANSQIPIDLLLRISVQTIGPLQNSTMLGEPEGSGSPGFFELIAALRRLQVAGALAIQYRESNRAAEVFLAIDDSGRSSQVVTDVQRVQELLSIKAKGGPYRIAYGESTANPEGSVALATRSILGILGNLGAEVRVDEDDVRSGATKPTIQLVGGATRPTIIVHSGSKAPADAYVAIVYAGRQYWIDRNDFDSKYAFSIVQDLMALAESREGLATPVVTIPAG